MLFSLFLMLILKIMFKNLLTGVFFSLIEEKKSFEKWNAWKQYKTSNGSSVYSFIKKDFKGQFEKSFPIGFFLFTSKSNFFNIKQKIIAKIHLFFFFLLCEKNPWLKWLSLWRLWRGMKASALSREVFFSPFLKLIINIIVIFLFFFSFVQLYKKNNVKAVFPMRITFCVAWLKNKSRNQRIPRRICFEDWGERKGIWFFIYGRCFIVTNKEKIFLFTLLKCFLYALHGFKLYVKILTLPALDAGSG